jgi:hypothetical protein
MHAPTLFRDRPRPLQVILGGVIPAIFGAITGIVLGVSAGGYWALSLVALLGGVLAGLEHRDGWGGADRGLVAGAIFGTCVLLAHTIAGTHAHVSLGSFPPFLAVITAIVGMFISAGGGRLARAYRERAGIVVAGKIAEP